MTTRSCPSCNRSEGTQYQCVDCAHKGCAKDHLGQRMTGCWTSGPCPKCGSTKKAIGVGTLG
jgi:hypothetical protein